MNIAILGGTGRQGKGLAMRFALAGHAVWVGSRTQQKADTAVAQMNETLAGKAQLQAADNATAARQAEVVFLTVPHPHELPTVEALKTVLKGKVLVDVSVPLSNYKPPEAELPPEGSAAEAIQHALGEQTPVVAAFKTTSSAVLQDIDRKLISDELVCSDHQGAKDTVIQLAERIGARVLDCGALRNARAMELMTALLIGLEQRYKKRDIGFRFSGV